MALFNKKSKENTEVKVDERLQHIAFIMDGNGRWAKKRGMPREYGHTQGAKVFKEITEYCGDIGINTVTVYAFSTENWKRPKAEVDAIMKLFIDYIYEALNVMMKKDICIKIYITVYCLSCILGAVMRLEAVWELSDMTVSLMTIINCSCVILLSKKHLKFK